MMKLVSLLPLLLCCSQAAVQACSYGELRLMHNSTTHIHIAGSVEICYLNGRWEPILNNQWDDQDAEVACNQLGFTNNSATAYQTDSYVYEGLTRFNCNGSESNLTDCQFIYSGQNGYSAGIKCLFHKPCPPQISPFYRYTTYVSFSWTGCSRDKVAPAPEYLVSCADYMQIQQSKSQAVYGLRPYKWYSCSVYGIDSLGRLGEGASFRFRTNQMAPQFAPYDFNYAFVSSRSVSLTWKPPPTDDRIGTITRYRIQYSCRTYYYSTCSTTRTHYASAQQSLTYAVSNLLSGEEYTFYIAACVYGTCGNTRSRLTVDIPPTVPGFTARSTSASTARLSWSRPNGGTRYYIIEATDRDTSMSETHYIANPATTSINLHSLHPYHQYEFSIAVYTVVKGPLVSQTVWMPQAVPTGGPHVVNCEVLNLTAVDMNWTEPHHLEQNGPIEHYWIYVWNKDTDELVYNTILKSPSEIQVTSLDPYHNYNCSVAAFARGGLGPFTTANVWLTDEADTSAPINLKPLKTGSKFVYLHWLEPHTRHQNTTVKHYKITIQSIEDNTAEIPVHYVQETSYNMTSLHPNYHYTITVEAVTLNTIGPNASINIQTEEDIPSDAPQNLRSTKVTPHSVTLMWEAPPLPSQNGDIIGYMIQVLREDNEASLTTNLTSVEPFLTVTKLDDDTKYEFSVAAKTRIGAGPYSIRITAKTKSYALEVTMYSLIGGCLLLVLILAIMASWVVYHCCGSKRSKCTSKWFIKRSTGLANVSLSEHGSRNDYNLNQHLRGSALRDGKEQTPELPNRDYLEDIDFVSKEFDLFFKRPPDLPARMDDNLNGDNNNETEEKVLPCSKDQPASMEKDIEEACHYMPLKVTQEGGQRSLYESLKPQKQQPTVYVNFKIKEESNSEGHYQPLMLATVESKDYTSSHYQSLNDAKLT